MMDVFCLDVGICISFWHPVYHISAFINIRDFVLLVEFSSLPPLAAVFIVSSPQRYHICLGWRDRRLADIAAFGLHKRQKVIMLRLFLENDLTSCRCSRFLLSFARNLLSGSQRFLCDDWQCQPSSAILRMHESKTRKLHQRRKNGILRLLKRYPELRVRWIY